MPRIEVTKPWIGVEVGEIFEVATVHKSLASHVRVLPEKGDDEEVDKSKGKKTASPQDDRRKVVIARLKELKVAHAKDATDEDLLALLPEGEKEKLFAEQ
jgi:hypothetical protein